jgi:GWxTD domain-containing protein
MPLLRISRLVITIGHSLIANPRHLLLRLAQFAICLLPFVTCPVPAAELPSPLHVDSLYSANLVDISDLPVSDQIDALRRFVRKHKKHAPVCDRIARLFMSMDTPRHRQRAKYWVKRAVRLDPENPVYQITAGDLLWEQGFWHNAEAQYREVLEQHPEHAEAAYRIGYRSLRQFLQSRDSRGPARTFAGAESRRAVDFLRKAVAADPTMGDALLQLGLTYIEMDLYDKVLSLTRRFTKEDDANADALLLAGLAYQAKGEYKEACSRYNRALAVMPEDERVALESTLLIADDPPNASASGPVHGHTTSPDSARTVLDAFWRERDPLLLTEYNERQMAHYGRVFYASLRFEDPLNGLKGWETDMGKAFIKFGPPPYKRSRGLDYPRGTSENASEFWTNTEFYFVPSHRPENPMAVWRYESFTLAFRGGSNPNSWVFDWAGDRRRGRRLMPRRPPSAQIFRETPPRYIDPYLRRKHSVPHQVTAFREGNGVRVEISYALPRSRMMSEHDSRVYSIDDGLFLFDRTWNEIASDRRQVNFSWDEPDSATRTRMDSIRTSYLFDRSQLNLDPGTYHLVLEARDPVSHTIATFRDAYTFAYPDTGLIVSDLLLASKIEPRSETQDSHRDLAIDPNPIRTFDADNPVFVYLEVYNLKQNAFGRTDYQITYQTAPPDKDDVDPRLFESFSLSDRTPTIVVESIDPGPAPRDNTETYDEVLMQELDPEEEARLSESDDAPDDPQFERAVKEASRPIKDYRVTYVLSDRNKSRDWVAKTLSSGPGSERAVTAGYEGASPDDFTYLQLDLRNVPPGIHNLTVSVYDVVAKRSAHRNALFRVVD